MVAGVISVGGKGYAVGLYWQVSDTPNAAKSARVAARQPGAFADFFCVRPGNAKGRAPQFGLGEQRLGHKWNMPSAAASMANVQPGSWAGVFVQPEGAWFIEVRDDLIAPEGDVMFADEAEAMSRLQETSAHGGLERIFAPAEWAIPGAESRSLSLLLSGKAVARLQPVRLPTKVIKGIVGGVVILAIMIVGLVFWLNQQQAARDQLAIEEIERQAAETKKRQELQKAEEERKKAEEAEKNRQAEEEKNRRATQEALTAPIYGRVWENTPKPLTWLAACRDTMDKVQISPLGWSLVSVVCHGNQVDASWSRRNGPAMVPRDALVDEAMKSATVSYNLPTLSPRGTELLWPADAIMLYTLNNDWSASLSYVKDPDLPPLPNGQRLPPPPWAKRKVDWEVPLSPWTMKGPFVDLPGLVLDSLTWNQNGTWKIEGLLYEQRK